MLTNAVNQSRNSDLKNHHKQQLASEIKVYNCSECGFTFPTLDDQKVHDEKIC